MTSAALRPSAASCPLDATEPLLEFPVGGPQAGLGIEPEMARELCRGEEQVPELLARLRPVSRGKRGVELGELFAQLVDHTRSAGPVEAHACGPLAELGGPCERGQADGDTVEHTAPAARRAFARLLRLPGRRYLRGAVRARLAEHVRVTALELVADRIDDVVECEDPGLLGDPGLAYHLEQQVAELVLHVRGIALADRILELVGLLDGVGGDALPGLLAVPGAAALRIAQPSHDLEQPSDGHGSGVRQQFAE